MSGQGDIRDAGKLAGEKADEEHRGLGNPDYPPERVEHDENLDDGLDADHVEGGRPSDEPDRDAVGESYSESSEEQGRERN